MSQDHTKAGRFQDKVIGAIESGQARRDRVHENTRPRPKGCPFRSKKVKHGRNGVCFIQRRTPVCDLCGESGFTYRR